MREDEIALGGTGCGGGLVGGGSSVCGEYDFFEA